VPDGERLHLLLDVDMSSRALVEMLRRSGHEVLAAGTDELKQLDDPILFAFAQTERRIVVTHNAADFPDVLREWAAAGRSHHGCMLSHLPTNAFAEMRRRFEGWFTAFPSPEDWIDRAVHL